MRAAGIRIHLLKCSSTAASRALPVLVQKLLRAFYLLSQHTTLLSNTLLNISDIFRSVARRLLRNFLFPFFELLKQECALGLNVAFCLAACRCQQRRGRARRDVVSIRDARNFSFPFFELLKQERALSLNVAFRLAACWCQKR